MPVDRLFTSVARRALADWPATLAAGLLLLAATTVVVAGAIYADAVTLGGLRRALDEVAPDDRNIRISYRSPAGSLSELDARAQVALADAMQAVGGEVVAQADASWFEPLDALALSGMRSYDPLEQSAALVDGRWPAAGGTPLEATVPQETAEALGIEVGDRFDMGDSRDPASRFEVVITGIWRAPASPLWDWVTERGPPEEAGAAGPLIVTRADLESLAVSPVGLELWAAPNFDRLTVDAIPVFRTDVSALPDRLRGSGAGGYTARTALPAILSETAESVVVTRAGILALGAQFAVLALYAVILVSSILVERRRAESTLLRARGASSAHLGTMACGEALLIAIPVGLVAPWLASTIVRTQATLAGAGDLRTLEAATLGGTPLLLATGALAVGVLALTLGAILFDRRAARPQAVTARPASGTMAQRLGLDLALVAVAAIGMWQLRLYGAPLTRTARGELGIDPLLIAAPALGLLVGALLATRLLPRAAEFGERGLTRLHGLIAPLAARTVARRPLRYIRSALLLMLAVALATFAALYTGTWERSRDDQATYQAGADVRVLGQALADAGEYRSIPSVQTVTPVYRDVVRVGGVIRDGVMFGIDPVAAEKVLSADTPTHAISLSGLDDERPETEAIPIDGIPNAITVIIDSRLIADPGPDPVEPPSIEGIRGVGAAVLLIDADSRLRRFVSAEGEEGLLQDGGQVRLEIPLTEENGEPAYSSPPGLLGVEVLLTPPPATPLNGSIELVGVEWSASEGAGGAVRVDPDAERWQWDRGDAFGAQTIQPDPAAAGRIVFGTPSSPSILGFNAAAIVLRLWAPPSVTEIPAVAGRSFLERSGSQLGDVVSVSGGPAGLRLRIERVVDEFPTLDPAVPFAIVDGPTLELAQLGQRLQQDLVSAQRQRPVVAPDEWWLGVEDGRDGEALLAVRELSPTSTVLGRDELAARLGTDPVPLGVIRVLGLGSLAAMTFAAIAFLVAATVSVRERVTEFAVLRALGLSAQQLASWLAIENAFLLAFGLLSGSAIGLALGWLVLPFASFTSDGSAAVPTPVVVIPWGAIAPLYAVSGLLFLASVAVVRQQLPSVRISDVLRGSEA